MAADARQERLADLRRKRGLSQEQLGYELGVSRQTVSKWELGQSYLDFQRLVLLSDYSEMSLNESEKQISSIYSDMERGKEAALRAWRAFLVVGCVVLALFAPVVAYGVSQGSLCCLPAGMLVIGPASDLVPLRAIMAEAGALSACLAIALFRRGSRARSWWEGPSVGIDRLDGPSRIERDRAPRSVPQARVLRYLPALGSLLLLPQAPVEVAAAHELAVGPLVDDPPPRRSPPQQPSP